MTSWLLIRTLLILVAVVLLIYCCLVLVKKRLNKSGAHFSDRIKIIEHKRVTDKLTIVLISVDAEQFLLATNPHAIALSRVRERDQGRGPC
ncbi:MAG TPA: hypothetical protein VEL47_06850 [Myxococcota bacterium]|nr:hypothetical protein [Myxococcota bacterium]